jgi:hypothetical protein
MSEPATDPAVEPTPAAEPSSLLGGNEPVTLEDGEFFLSEGVKGTGEVPDWYQSSKYKSVSEQAKGYNEIRQKLGGFTGAPEEGYSLPESIEEGDDLFTSLSGFAKDANMNQDTFDKAWELLATQSGVDQEINQELEMGKLGDNATTRIQNVENALKFRMGEDYESVKDMVYDANSVMLAESLIKAFAPKKLPMEGGDNPQGLTWAAIEVEMNKKDDHGRFLRSSSPEHNAKVERMMAAFGGDKTTSLVVG